MNNELKIPYAVDNQGLLFSPSNATKQVDYFCPSCNASVIFRNGEVKVPHFAHKASLTCTGESITHKIAKGLIRQAVLDWKSGKGECPRIIRYCSYCHKEIPQRLPATIDDAIEEYTLDDFRVDVCLMSEGKPTAAIEVCVTHKVNEHKHNELSIPYLELDGFDVVDNPLRWSPSSYKLNKASNFCSDICENKYKKIAQWSCGKIGQIRDNESEEDYDKKIRNLIKKVVNIAYERELEEREERKEREERERLENEIKILKNERKRLDNYRFFFNGNLTTYGNFTDELYGKIRQGYECCSSWSELHELSDRLHSFCSDLSKELRYDFNKWKRVEKEYGDYITTLNGRIMTFREVVSELERDISATIAMWIKQ